MTQKATAVGGVPIYFSAAWADPGAAAVTVDTPDGFFPDLVVAIDNTGTNPNIFIWQKDGNANPGGIQLLGSSGVTTYVTTNGFTVADGSIILGTDIVSDNITGTVHAWRYQQ